MKIGLIGVNSQFVHSNLALYYLREELSSSREGEIREYNNNEPILKIFYDIMAQNFDVLAFSVYLWNKETVLKLTELIRSAAPEIKIILGGPEPTYAPGIFMPMIISFTARWNLRSGRYWNVWSKICPVSFRVFAGKFNFPIPGNFPITKAIYPA